MGAPKVTPGPLVFSISKLLYFTLPVNGIVWAAEPLKLTVLPVTVYAFAPGANVPATPTVPGLAKVRRPVELLVRLL